MLIFHELVIRKVAHAGGNTEMGTVPQGVFRVVSFEMKIRNVMANRIWNEYCSNKCVIPAENPRCCPVLSIMLTF